MPDSLTCIIPGCAPLWPSRLAARHLTVIKKKEIAGIIPKHRTRLAPRVFGIGHLAATKKKKNARLLKPRCTLTSV